MSTGALLIAVSVVPVVVALAPPSSVASWAVVLLPALVAAWLGWRLRSSRCESARQRLESLKAGVLDAAIDAVVSVDDRGKIIEMNRAAERLFGVSRKDITGRSFCELLRRRRRPGGLNRVLSRFLSSAGTGPDGHRINAVARKSDGTEFPAEIAVTRSRTPGGWVATGFVRDISGWRKAERALRESESRNRGLVEQAADAMFVLNSTGRIVDVNRRACESLGHSRGDLVGRFLADFEVQSGGHDFRGGQTATLEATHRRKDGSTFPVEVRLGILGTGEHRQTLALARDVSARRRAEAALRESERRFRETLERSRLVAVWLDREGRVTFCNEALLALTGRRAGEVVGQNWFDTFIPPESRDSIKTRFLKNVQTGDILVRFEAEVLARGGERRLIAWTNTLLRDPEGRPIGTSSLGEDVTERRRAEAALRKSEALFRLVWDTAADAMRLTDEKGTVVLANSAYCRLVGRPSSELVGRNLAEAYADSRRADIARKHHERFVSRTVRPYFEAEVELWDGRRRWFEAGNAFLDAPGEPSLLLGVLRDVTDRKRAESALRESEERYRLLFESNPHPMWVFETRSLRFLAVNEAASLQYGYSRNDFLRMTILDLLPSDEVAPFQEELRQPGSSGHTSTWRHQWKDGTVREVAITSHALTIGDIAAELVLAMDVTERKRAEAALRESEERFRRLFEDSPIGIYRTTPDGRILLANPAAVRMAGCESFQQLAAMNFETDEPYANYDRAEFKRRLETDGEIRGLEAAWKRRDGSLVYIRENARAVRGPDGRIVYYEGTLEDITERRRAEMALREREELLRNVISHIPGGVFWKDRDSVYLGCNELVARNAGRTSPAELIGLTDFDMGIDPAEAVFYRTCDRQVMETGEAIVNLEETQTRDGGQAVLLTSKVPLRDESGNVVGILGIYQDITDRKRLEDQLRQAQKMEAVGRLAGGVAHDFNNLLTVINGFSQVALDILGPENSVRPLVEEIVKAGDRAAGLTRQLLTFSRQQVVSPRVIDLNAVVGDTDRMLRRVIGEDVILATDLEPGLWSVRADPGQIEQVLMNLVVNSRDAMPTGGQLTIATQNVSADCGAPHPNVPAGDWVVLAVRDTGVGMSDDVRARVFEPFFTTKGVGKGTGLGLATVYGIVTGAGGHVTVQSQPNCGTTFTIYLPRVECPNAEPLAARCDEPLPMGTETILLAEDEPAVRALDRQVLASCGYTVLEAADGREAVEIAERLEGPLHLLVSDVVMPHLGGRQLAERLHAHRPRLKVLFVSGYTDDEVVRHGVGHEFAFLQKPFTPTVLARKVREVLDRSHANGETPIVN